WVRLDQTAPPVLRAFGSIKTGQYDDMLREPGSQFFLKGDANEDVFAWHDVAGASRISAMILSGSDARRVGCLRASSALAAKTDTSTDTFSICRTKTQATRVVDAGSPNAERLHLIVESCVSGVCSSETIDSLEPAPGGVGDLVELAIDTSTGKSCATARSSR